MKRSNLFVLLVVLGFGSLSFRKAPPDLSSPKAAVKSFVAAIKAGDLAALAACVKNGVESPELNGIFAAPERLAFDVTEILAETEGSSAKVAVEYNYSQGTRVVSQVDILPLEKNGAVWQIAVAPDALPKFMTNPQGQEGHIIKLLTILVGDPKGMDILKQARAKAQAISSLSNVKQIATGAMMYVQDYDEVYPTPASKFKDNVMPYIKNEQIFHAPIAPPAETVSYSFNKSLQGVSLAAIDRPAETVMIYEGKDGKPEYRYEGKTVIGFADGHAKLCSADEVAQFVWSSKNWKLASAPKPVVQKPIPKKKPTKKR